MQKRLDATVIRRKNGDTLLTVRGFLAIVLIIIVWAFFITLIVLNRSNQSLQLQKKQIANFVMTATLSLSGVSLAVIGILISILWTPDRAKRVKTDITYLLATVTMVSVLAAISCLVAFTFFSFGIDFLFMPMLILFFSTIYYLIIATIAVVWLSIR